MKKKAKLAFELLEKELELMSIEEMRNTIGGHSGRDDPLPNGYCVFNAYSYLLYGDTNRAQNLFNDFAAEFPGKVNYNADGTVGGVVMGENQSNFLDGYRSPDQGMFDVMSHYDFDLALALEANSNGLMAAVKTEGMEIEGGYIRG